MTEELDLRAELEKSFAETESVEDAFDESPSERLRDEKGRFAAKQQDEAAEVIDAVAPEIAAEVVETEVASTVTAQAAIQPPNGWPEEAKTLWQSLPAQIQAAVDKREQDVAKFTSKSDDERQFGRSMYKTVQPYMAQIQAEGGTPESAVQQLLNTAYVLRVGSPEQKRQLLLQTAQQFGIDITPPEPSDADPKMQQLLNKINQLEGAMRARQRQEQNQLQAEIQTEIQAFATNSEHAHYEEVKAHMAALLREGAAKDLQDAYDQACWARPDIRATLLSKQNAEQEQKRKADAKLKAEQAKRKGVGLTGGPGNTGAAPGSQSLRSELEAAFASASSGV